MTSPLSPPQAGGIRGESTRSARSENVISRLPALKTHPPIDPGPTRCPSLLVEASLKGLAQKKETG